MSKLSTLGEQFFAQGKVEDCPIYDMHGHMGPYYGMLVPVITEESTVYCMDRAGVKMLVFSHHAAIVSCQGNAKSVTAVRKFPHRLRAYCAINPNLPDTARKDLETFDDNSDVYVGFKFLSDYHNCRLTDDRYKLAWEMADSKGLIVLLHTWGGSQFTGYEQLSEVAERYPNAKIVAGHSIHGNWDHAIDLVKYFPNTYLELCAVVDEEGVLEKFVSNLGSERILFGTDFPWFDFHYYIGAILGAQISDEDRRNIFYRNAQRLLKL